jgi:hypothetical protein
LKRRPRLWSSEDQLWAVSFRLVLLASLLTGHLLSPLLLHPNP